MDSDKPKQATLYRMVMKNHLCPYGLKSKDLLEREGFDVDDRHLTTRANRRLPEPTQRRYNTANMDRRPTHRWLRCLA